MAVKVVHALERGEICCTFCRVIWEPAEWGERKTCPICGAELDWMTKIAVALMVRTKAN